jgi:hypothetical protein
MKLFNLRKYDTRRSLGSLHSRVQSLWGHDDLQGAPCGSVQVALTGAQYGDVVVEMLLDSPESPCPSQYVVLCSPCVDYDGL